MILKAKDSLDEQLQRIDSELQGGLSSRDKEKLEKQRASILAGLVGEREAAYHIDFYLRDNPNWIVIHDLRLESNGRVAQIDHLLINRVFETYVVESKCFKTKVRHANGGWERLNLGHWEGIPCPAEQNTRHITVLEDVLRLNNLIPRRFGIPLTPEFVSVVLFHPSCSIIGNFPQEVRVFRMDKFVNKIRGEDPATLSLLKLVSSDTLKQFGTRLVAHHKPAPVREAALVPRIEAVPLAPESKVCSGCGGPISTAEICFCQSNKIRFGGAVFCRKCQANSSSLPVKSPISRSCEKCGKIVENNVANYCRIHKQRFGGQTLCRSCQRTV